MGAELPKEIEVRVIEEIPNAVTFVLPRAVSNVQELSDRELKKLAGGACQGMGRGETQAAMDQTVQVDRFGGDRGACTERLGSSGPGG